MTISIPKITANATVATVAEGGDPTGTTAITSAYVDATVIKKASFSTLFGGAPGSLRSELL
jgi:hypothetical protein